MLCCRFYAISHTVGTLGQTGGTVNNSGKITNLNYTGGTFNGTGGSIDALTVFGNADVNQVGWGTVDNLAFDTEYTGYMTIAGFLNAEGNVVFKNSVNANFVYLSNANIQLTLDANIFSSVWWAGLMTGNAEPQTVFSLNDIFGNWEGTFASFTFAVDGQVDGQDLSGNLPGYEFEGSDGYLYMVGYGDGDFTVSASRNSSTPEPATLALMGLGLAGVGLASRRRRK